MGIFLAPLFAAACVAAGWRSAGDRAARSRLVLTQTLHWLAFLVVMNSLCSCPAFNGSSPPTRSALAIFTLLTLGAFTAGVHVLSWRICLLGLIMAFGIPAIAWIENSALIFALAGAVALAIVVVFFRYWGEARPQPNRDGERAPR